VVSGGSVEKCESFLRGCLISEPSFLPALHAKLAARKHTRVIPHLGYADACAFRSGTINFLLQPPS